MRKKRQCVLTEHVPREVIRENVSVHAVGQFRRIDALCDSSVRRGLFPETGSLNDDSISGSSHATPPTTAASAAPPPKPRL